MVTAAACPRLFEYPPLEDSEHYVETTLFGHYSRASQKKKKHEESSSSECDQKFLMHSQNTTEDGKDMYLSRLSCVCTAVTMCQHHLRPSFLPLQKKNRSKGSSLYTCDQQVITGGQEHNVLSSMCCLLGGARNDMSRRCRFQNRNFVFLHKITPEGISGDHGRN